MSCCGGKRRDFRSGATPVAAGAAPRAVWAAAEGAPVMLEYTGARGARVRGPATGKIYRFAGSGSRVVVDGRDAPALLAFPRLRPVR